MIKPTKFTINEPKSLMELQSQNIPSLGSQRPNKQEEIYDICFLLRILAANDSSTITYPFELILKEKPDFLLETGIKKYGCEHVGARNCNDVQRTVIAQDMGKSKKFLHCPRYKPIVGGEKASRKSLTDSIYTNQHGEGWLNNEVEEDWIEGMKFWIDAKNEKLKKYERFDEDWLLIYDCLPLPAVDRRKAILKLWSSVYRNQKFHRIFIISPDHSYIYIMHSAGINVYCHSQPAEVY